MKKPPPTNLDERSHVVEFLHEDSHLLVDAGGVMVGEVETAVEHHGWSHERGWVRFWLLINDNNNWWPNLT